MRLYFKIAYPMWCLYTLPPKKDVKKAIIGFSNTRIAVADTSNPWIPVQDATEAVEAYRELDLSFRKTFSLDEDILLPVQAILCPNDLPSNLWEIAPPGCLLVPAKSFDSSTDWIGPWQVADIHNCFVDKDPFPYRNLLLVGTNKQECFFCGNHDHTSDKCPNPWGYDNNDLVRELAQKPLDLWKREIQRILSYGSHGKALSDIKRSLRMSFQWNTVLRVCSSTATSLSELWSAPVKPMSQINLGPVLTAIKNKELKKAKKLLSTFDPDSSGVFYSIIMGMLKASENNLEEARAAWLSAYRNSATPLQKAYSALLLSRVYWLSEDLERAEELIFESLQADSTAPQCNYWRLIIASMQRRTESITPTLKRFSMLPRWFVAIVMEPLLLPYSKIVTKEFNEALSDLETKIDNNLKEIDFLVEGFELALGEKIMEPYKIKLRDWRGSRNNMGYIDLVEAPSFLSEFRQEIRKVGYGVLREIIIKTRETKQSLDLLYSKPIYSPKGRKLRLEAARLSREAERILELLSDFKHIKRLENIKNRADALTSEASALIEKLDAAIKSDQRLVLVGKVIGRLLLAGGIIWIIYALWDLVRTLLLG